MSSVGEIWYFFVESLRTGNLSQAVLLLILSYWVAFDEVLRE